MAVLLLPVRLFLRHPPPMPILPVPVVLNRSVLRPNAVFVITGRVGLERIKTNGGIKLAGGVDLEGIGSQSGVETGIAPTGRWRWQGLRRWQEPNSDEHQ